MESTLYFKYGVCVRGQLSYSFNTYVKEKNYIEETNERMNEFSFAYMCNPTLYRHKVFKEQVKLCLNNTFGADTNKQINFILLRPNTRVIVLIVSYDHGSYTTIEMFKLLNCVVYISIDKYVCIDYLCTEEKN